MPHLFRLLFVILSIIIYPSYLNAQILPTHSVADTPSPQLASTSNASSITLTGNILKHTPSHSTAVGDAQLHYLDNSLSSESIEYLPQQQQINVNGLFHFNTPNYQIQGDALHYNLKSQAGTAHNIYFQTQNQTNRIQANASQIAIETPSHYRLQDAQFNTCQINDNSWYFSAKDVILDTQNHYATIHRAKLMIHDIPIMYIPQLSLPINRVRKSGILFPSLQISNNGIELGLPYYANLAPNYDLTITPKWISQRGIMLNGEFRYLQPRTSGLITTEWLPYDSYIHRHHRYSVNWQHQQHLSDTTQLDIHIEYPSDKDYFDDFNPNHENIYPTQNITVSHASKLFSGSLNLSGTLQNSSGIQVANHSLPYARLPELTAHWHRFLNAHIELNLLGQLTYFHHPKLPSGSRWRIAPSIGLNWIRPWGFIHTAFTLDNRIYQPSKLSKQFTQHRQTRPIISIASGLTFERLWQIHHQPIVHTIKPTLHYLYTPAITSNHLPVFDHEELFLTPYPAIANDIYFFRYPYFAANNVLTPSITTQLTNAKTGKTYLSASLSKHFYLTPPPSPSHRYPFPISDLNARITSELIPDIKLESHWDYSTAQSHTNFFDIGFTYQPQDNQYFAVRYRHQPQTYQQPNASHHQIELATHWSWHSGYEIIGKYRYDWQKKSTLQQIIGVGYQHSCGCWNTSLVGKRQLNQQGEYKYAVLLQLQLHHLTGLGNNLSQQLHQALGSTRLP